MKQLFFLTVLGLTVVGCNRSDLPQVKTDDTVQVTPSDPDHAEIPLVRLQGDQVSTLPSDHLANKDYIAVYYSASWCPPCKFFTPELVRFYDKAIQVYDNFEIILFSNDYEQEAMENYMLSDQITFPALAFEEISSSSLIDYAAEGIPYLVVLDREGNQVLPQTDHSGYVDPTEVLNAFNQLLMHKGKLKPKGYSQR